MGPVKFDDLPKVAKDILNEDYKSAGYEFKAKQKIGSTGALVTTTVDASIPAKKDVVATPAKVTLKFPTAFGLKGFTVDKLDYTKAGAWALETKLDKGLHTVDGLEIAIKSDLADAQKVSTALTFTRIANTRVALTTKPFNPADVNFEASYSASKDITLGLKAGTKNLTEPDIGLRLTFGGVFAALSATNKFKTFEVMAHYSPVDALDLAISAKKDGAKLPVTVGLKYALNKETSIKAKVSDAGDVNVAVKYKPTAGFTMVAGGNQKGFGLSLQIE